MKILFTSIGRRVELMQAFQHAAKKIGMTLEIYGADITDTAPALQFCDHTIIVPRIIDESYIPTLKKVCEDEKIDALIPTIDLDLLILSHHKHEFDQTKVLVSAEDKIALCWDKRFTAGYFHSVGLKSPTPVDDWTMYDAGYPAFIKPRNGSSSIFAYKAQDINELKYFAERVPNYIIQPFIEGTEYSVDILCDYDGNPIFITPRIRLAVRAGEVLKTEIRQDQTIISEMMRLIADFKPCGQITVQLIQQKDTRDNCYIEINPRFGGGAPLTIMAGADSAEMILRMLNGEKVEYQVNAAEDGAVFSRYDQCVRVR